ETVAENDDEILHKFLEGETISVDELKQSLRRSTIGLKLFPVVVGTAFKNMADPYVGQLTFIRVYSGQLKSGESVLNSRTQKHERIGRLLKMHANKREDIQE